jgi:hypothetical protein
LPISSGGNDLKTIKANIREKAIVKKEFIVLTTASL